MSIFDGTPRDGGPKDKSAKIERSLSRTADKGKGRENPQGSRSQALFGLAFCSELRHERGMRILWWLTVPMLALSVGAAGTPNLILHHGRVVTVDKQFSIQQAIAIEGNQIVQVGANEAVLKLEGKQTRVIDLQGRMALPGLIDSHTHPLSAAMTEFDHEIPDMGSIEDVRNYFRQRAQ